MSQVQSQRRLFSLPDAISTCFWQAQQIPPPPVWGQESKAQLRRRHVHQQPEQKAQPSVGTSYRQASLVRLGGVRTLHSRLRQCRVQAQPMLLAHLRSKHARSTRQQQGLEADNRM